MGNNPSKPENNKTSSSPVNHGQPGGSSAHRKVHSRRETAPSTSQTPGSPSVLDADSLSPPRKPSLRPQEFFPDSTGQNIKRDSNMGNSQSHERQDSTSRKEDAAPATSSGPVSVPASSQQARRRRPDSNPDATMASGDPAYVPVTNLNFPPRLPLPIQEEAYTPGSPIITPDDLSAALLEDTESAEPLQTSFLSRTTLDDEEVDLDPSAKGKTVPTTIQWTHGGNKVYITGTFANWSKKYRMHRR